MLLSAKDQQVFRLVKRRYYPGKLICTKLLALLLLFSIQSATARTLSQNVNLDLKNVTLRKACELIEKATGYNFIYNKTLLEKENRVTFSFRNTPLKQVMDELLKGRPLTYTIIDRFVTIAPKPFPDAGDNGAVLPGNIPVPASGTSGPVLTDNLSAAGFLADSTVHGIVKDATKGEPLKGASVYVKGTKHGTLTNDLGEFELRGVSSDATLVISMTGYKERQIKVSSTTMSIVMTEESANLSEVVVTGFQKVDRKKFTGSAITIKADSIKIDGVTDVSRMLEGRAAGVSIQNVSGTFGTAPKVRVRGATSISGSNKPLWVVDGVVLEDIVNVSNEQLTSGDASTLLGSSVAGLNVNDIETFDILKDASAAALYGARAMNGVIVITTKKGKIGKPIISYSGNFGVQLKPSYNSYDVMSSADMMSIYAEMERKGYLVYPDMVNASSSGLYGKLATLTQIPQADGSFAVLNTPEARKAWLMQYANTNTNWFDVLFRNSLTQEHSLSISTGTDKMKSYFSTSFYNDQGWTIADNVKRYTINLNNTYTPTSKLSFGFSLNGSVRQQTSPGTEERNTDSARGAYRRQFDNNLFSYALGTSRALPVNNPDGSLAYFTQNYAPFNIVNETRNNTTKTGILDVALKGFFSYKLLPNLTYEFTGSLRYAKTTQEHEVREKANQAEAYRANGTSIINDANPYLYRDPLNPSFPKIVVLPYGGFYDRADITLSNYTIRNQLTYNNTWGEENDHQLTAFAGQEIIYLNRQTSTSNGVGYQYGNGAVPYNYYYYFQQLFQSNKNYYGLGNQYQRFVGLYANVNYTYKGKYTIEGTLREDGANLMGISAKTRWLPTWTVAGLWNIDQEKFMENSSVFSHLMLKTSYGLNASPGNANNSTTILNSMTTNRPYPIDQQPSVYIKQLQNSQLTWEKAYTWNVTLDMGFFKNRLTVMPEYYRRRSFGLIAQIHTAGIAGQVDQYANYADLHSHGAELTIIGKVIQKKDFSFTSSFNFGWGVSKIVNSQETPPVWKLIGEGGGAKNGYPVRGLFSLVNTSLDNSFYTSGVPTYINEDGNSSFAVNLNSLTTKYLRYEGPSDPTVTGGWTNTFRYKGFSLNVLLTFQAGNKIRLTPVYERNYSDLSSLPTEFKSRWTLPGDEKLTSIPSMAYMFTNYGNFGLENIPAYPYSNYNWSHERVADGGFIRMKAVTLSYQLPTALINRIGFKATSVSVTANNPWLIYSDSRLHGQDPEFYRTGGVAMPINKQITGSLRVAL